MAEWPRRIAVSAVAFETVRCPALAGIANVIACCFEQVDTIFFMTGSGGSLVNDIGKVEFDITAVPEPASMTLLGVGALAMLRRPR